MRSALGRGNLKLKTVCRPAWPGGAVAREPEEVKMSPRKAKFILLAAVAVGTVFQLGSCLSQGLIQIAGVALLDLFLSPLVGDTYTLWDRIGG